MLIQRSVNLNYLNQQKDDAKLGIISFMITDSGQNIYTFDEFNDYCLNKISNNSDYDLICKNKNYKKLWLFIGVSDI